MRLSPAIAQGNTHHLLRAALLAVAGSILIALSARIQVPMWPVPMTLQTFAVLFIGLTYGGRLATATLLLYLAEGAIGLPVFAAGGGLAHLVGPTGGYLVGFLLAASLLGFAVDRGLGKTLVPRLALLIAATVLIYVMGVSWLSGFVGLEKAVAVGMVPFLWGDAIKAALAALIAPFGRSLLVKK